MSGLTQLGMTDVASRPRSRRVWWGGLWVGVAILLFALVRNLLFARAGLFDPNFGVIHQAYRFNLGTLPLIFGLVGVLCAGLAVTWTQSRRTLLWLALAYGFIALDLLALRYYVTYVEPERLVVQHIRLETPKLGQPLRILHVTDLHVPSVGPYEKRVFEQIEALQPDLIINTGDFTQVLPPANFQSEWPKLHAMIARVNPRLGTYGVFGDTEVELYHVAPEDLEPLAMLSSRNVRIDTGHGVLSLHGLSLFQSQKGDWAMRSVEPWLQVSAPEEFRILMGHSPNYALAVGDALIDLCLAGHTHGGQVVLPLLGPPIIDSDIPREWASGFRRIGIPYLNVSAGAGSNRHDGLPPIRLNCPTEMTLIELVPMRPIR